MMQNLNIGEGSEVQLETIALPTATFAKFQPQSIEFNDITDTRAVLENELRQFSCLTVGDIIGIKYNEKYYELLVVETLPAQAVYIIDCDLQVS